VSWLRRGLRELWCLIANGHHEYYTARTASRIYQECVVCGHCTKGWDVSTTRTGKERL
jgi:hypothetical protein